MSIWKDLLFLGGHFATPTALDDTPVPQREAARPLRKPESAPRADRSTRISSSEILW